MTDLKLHVVIEGEKREDLIYWLERLAEKLRDNQQAISGRSSGGGYMDWHIDEVYQ